MNYSLLSSESCRVTEKNPCHTISFKIGLPKLTCSSSKARSLTKALRVKWTPNNWKLIIIIFQTFLLFISISLLSIKTEAAEAQMSHNGFHNNDKLNNGIFMQLPFSHPPTVRPPPYAESDETCPEVNERENWVDTLCGDLNKGYVPTNPLGHKFPDGSSYPFDTIKNKTLQFFRHALPVLKNDKSLPKVARFNPYQLQEKSHYRSKRSSAQSRMTSFEDPTGAELWSGNDSSLEPIEGRSSRGLRQTQFYGHGQQGPNSAQSRFCDKPPPTGSLLCKLYNAMWGKAPHQHQRRQESNEQKPYHQYLHQRQYAHQPLQQLEEQNKNQMKLHSAESKTGVSTESLVSTPATPCPSSAEYLTPVFARNHEGAWRYVVQSPREGYFTQTVEVTKCTETNCFYMEGSCRTSPRWQSLLVAEMFYPDTAFPNSPPRHAKPEPHPPQDLSHYQQYLQKRAGTSGGFNDIAEVSPTIPPQCDGVDKIGCFQVRLFYDWFLIPGSCKCWKRQFDFTRVHQS